MSLTNYFLVALFCSLLYFSLWFVAGLFIKRFDFIDVAWGGGFIAVALTTLAIGDYSLYFVQKLILLLVGIWGVRLMFHIFMRNIAKSEDARYIAMYSKWKKFKFLNIFLRIYILQAILLVLVAMPIIATASATDPFNDQLLLGIGFALWAIGFAFEFFADKQLADFIKNPKNKGKIMTSGVWKYSRHPNYFGEVTLWWGIWLISVSLNPVWWSAIGPITISYLILFVSGVPMLEKKYASNKAFQTYAQKTSKFIPLPPKK